MSLTAFNRRRREQKKATEAQDIVSKEIFKPEPTAKKEPVKPKTKE